MLSAQFDFLQKIRGSLNEVAGGTKVEIPNLLRSNHELLKGNHDCLDQLFELFCEHSQFEGIETLIDLGASLKHANEGLWFCVSKNKPDTLLYLLKAGANPNFIIDISEEVSVSPIEVASTNAHLECIDVLIEHNARIPVSLLETQINARRVDVAAQLLEKYSLPDYTLALGCYAAASFNDSDLFQKMLSSIKEIDKQKQMYLADALINAASNGYLEIVTTLIDAGVAVDARNTKYNKLSDADSTALSEASLHGDLDVVKYLVSKGASVNEQLPLSNAVHKQHPQVVKFLLEHCKISQQYITLCLTDLAEQFNAVIGALLFEHGADVNYEIGLPMCRALWIGNHDSLNFMLDYQPEQASLVRLLSEACTKPNVQLVRRLFTTIEWPLTAEPQVDSALVTMLGSAQFVHIPTYLEFVPRNIIQAEREFISRRINPPALKVFDEIYHSFELNESMSKITQPTQHVELLTAEIKNSL
ncbi:MAG: ankyrin repeat domain-containing protein [Endozoicomonadaceae bacterium]|nr:ankyrin repeat domain-containing protein [Endozoicomonadaceae bacterium]